MKLSKFTFSACAAIALFNFALAGVVYDATVTGGTSGNSYFYDSTNIGPALDDGAFPSTLTFPVHVTNFEGAYYILTPNTPFDMVINFYNEPSYANYFSGVTNSSNIGLNGNLNTNYIGGIRLHLPGGAVGSHTTGAIVLPSTINFPSQYFDYEVTFTTPNTNTISDAAVVMFAPGPLVIGSNQDVFLQDFDLDGQYSTSEYYDYGGSPDLTQMYLSLDNTPILVGTVVLNGWSGITLPKVNVTVNGGSPILTSLSPVTGHPNQGTFAIYLPTTGTTANVTVKPQGFLSQSKTLTLTGSNQTVTFDNGSGGSTGNGLIPGDIDDSNTIDDVDLLAVINNFLGAPPTGNYDANGDGILDDIDLLDVINNFLATGS